MAKQKLSSIDLRVDGHNKISLDVRFQDVPVKLSGDEHAKGFYFRQTHRNNLPADWESQQYKLVKKDGYILLQCSKNNPGLTGLKRIMRYSTYPCYGAAMESIQETYGTNFSYTVEGSDIKLFPILVEEVKQVTSEILDAVKRYETENNLSNKNNEI